MVQSAATTIAVDLRTSTGICNQAALQKMDFIAAIFCHD